MTRYMLNVQLLSDATFGRGDGVAGLIDQEVEHDADGFPYLRGRTLKGLLSEECDNILAVLPDASTWYPARLRLFGAPGSDTSKTAEWHFGDARLPAELREAVSRQLRAERAKAVPALTPALVLDSLTTIRRQSARDARTGTPDAGSLRSTRVVIRGLAFTSELEASGDKAQDRQLLAASCLALRHLGLTRNRGRGTIACTLLNAAGKDLTPDDVYAFGRAIGAQV